MRRDTPYIARKIARQMRWAKQYLFPLIQKHLPMSVSLDIHGPHGVGIDLGCGMGANTVALAKRGCRMVGMDQNTGSILEANELAGEHGLNESQCEFIDEELNQPSVCDVMRFDFALALDVIEHTDPYQLFNIAHSALKRKTGIAVFTFPPAPGPFGLHQQTLSWCFSHVPWAGLLFPNEYYRHAITSGDSTAATAAHFRMRSNTFEVLAEGYGFTILTKRRYLVRPERSRFAVRLPNWCPDWMTSSMLYVLRKEGGKMIVPPIKGRQW